MRILKKNSKLLSIPAPKNSYLPLLHAQIAIIVEQTACGDFSQFQFGLRSQVAHTDSGYHGTNSLWHCLPQGSSSKVSDRTVSFDHQILALLRCVPDLVQEPTALERL